MGFCLGAALRALYRPNRAICASQFQSEIALGAFLETLALLDPDTPPIHSTPGKPYFDPLIDVVGFVCTFYLSDLVLGDKGDSSLV